MVKCDLWLNVEFAQYKTTKMLRMEAPTSMINKKSQNDSIEKQRWDVTVSCTLCADEIINAVSTTML